MIYPIQLHFAAVLAAVAATAPPVAAAPAPLSLNQSRTYAWVPGSVYRLDAAPGEISMIALEQGEALLSVASGDTARWVIAEAASGPAAEWRTYVLVKPIEPGLRTNLVIATDRRVYLVALESSNGPATPAISWTYAETGLLALSGKSAPPAAGAPELAIERLNFGYSIAGDRPSWRPVRAFDDGHQVFIEFPPSVRDGELPPLFALDDNGKAEIVNYRRRGLYYVVDRLFSAAELRLGERRQQRVRISRAAWRGR